MKAVAITISIIILVAVVFLLSADRNGPSTEGRLPIFTDERNCDYVINKFGERVFIKKGCETPNFR